MDIEDTEACYRVVKSRDRRFDGVFYTAVRTTGIYCRPSCPAVTPKMQNVSFYRSAGAAQSAGYRACRRCLPDATPGSPEWDLAGDLAGRTMRLIADGVVERDGVEGLARRLGYTSRHLGRVMVNEVGAGPLALARARRAQTARILIEKTPMKLADVAFASGFASIRQFNDTIRAVYASSPSELRGRRRPAGDTPGQLDLRLPARAPFRGADLFAFLAARAVPGVERAGEGWFERTLALPHGAALVHLSLPGTEVPDGPAYVACRLRVSDLRDVGAAVERCRRMLDADCDPVAVDDQLSDDPRLSGLVRRRPGLRVPGHVDGHEIAVRAVLGQQISVARARAVAAGLVERYGAPLAEDLTYPGAPDRLFPDASTLAALASEDLPMPRSRGRALIGLCAALARGDVVLDRSAERGDVRLRLLALPGIGPWTADYIAMRALGDPDVLLATDLGTRHALEAMGEDPRRAAQVGQAWAPWRSYAQMHLWSSLQADQPAARQTKEN